jgi:hypothetical protein
MDTFSENSQKNEKKVTNALRRFSNISAKVVMLCRDEEDRRCEG